MSFLSVFRNVLHVVEAAAAISAPIIATQDPTIGALMTMANNSAIGIEAAITTPGTGAQKAAVVDAQTKAAIGVANAILASQNKPPLPATTEAAISASVMTTVSALNAISVAVSGAK